MKTEIEYLLVADSVILEQETGKASVIGIFQGFKMPDEGLILPITIFTRIKGVKGHIKVIVSLYNPDGKKLIESVPIEGDVDSEAVQIRAILPLIPFKKDGRYRIKVEVNGKELDSTEEHSILVSK